MRDTNKFRPSEYMRARRPELFSDSTIITSPTLTQEVFEYQLNTLTNRKQEIEFEHFCRRLLEKEICPNLIPQTGPTGGGDSKVDTETYPVADTIAMRWYEGNAREASNERWAFAFSTKKDWRAKVNTDVAKIVATDRDYKLIYFVTSQFIKDKTRAEVEEELKKKYKIPVRLLDRTWLVKCVFEHEQVKLAVETLGLTGYGAITEKQIGPYDAQREIDLKELENRINDPAYYGGVDYQLAEDCLQTAIIARGLNRPRTEVEGRFERAERIGNKVKNTSQQLRIKYARAWTAFWWYDDFDTLNNLYDDVEHLAINSTYSTELELLANLWTTIHSSVKRGHLTSEVAKLAPRTEVLNRRLDELASERKRPNNALSARIQRILLDIVRAMYDSTLLDNPLQALKEALIESTGLAESPIQPILDIIQELGDFLSESTVYDELFEVVVRITADRTSAGESGTLLLKRGTQKLKAGKRYDAIKLLGRAQVQLAMHEYSSERFAALIRCAIAYESAGLLWAARANTLLALNQILAEYSRNGEMSVNTLKCIQRLIWLELQLGRVSSALAWIEFLRVVSMNVFLDNDSTSKFTEEYETQDLIVGLLLLKTELWELKWLDFLPGILEQLGLTNARMALLYTLGYESRLRADQLIQENESEEAVKEVFTDWLKLPANEDLPTSPEFMRGRTVRLSSFVLGCEVIVEAENSLTSLYLAETILSALEAFLATSLDGHLFPYRPNLHIELKANEQVHGLPEYLIDETNTEHTVVIRHNRVQPSFSRDEKDKYQTWLLELILKLVFLIGIPENMDSFIKEVVEEERSTNRALEFSDIALIINNILGQTPKFKLSDWSEQSDSERFPLRRTTAWDYGFKVQDPKDDDESDWKPGLGDIPEDLFGVDNLKHKDRRVYSHINIALWNEAEWAATAYICVPNYIPMLILGFKNASAAKRIFEEWQSKFGQADQDEELRVSIVTGISRRHPFHYKVKVSSNLKRKHLSRGNHAMLISRFQHMQPPDLNNLNGFITSYRQAGSYYLLPAHFTSENDIDEPFWDLRIQMQKLDIRPAWQIGENDPDVVLISEDDDPIIPKGVEDAPVIHALNRIKTRRR